MRRGDQRNFRKASETASKQERTWQAATRCDARCDLPGAADFYAIPASIALVEHCCIDETEEEDQRGEQEDDLVKAHAWKLM